MQWVMVAQLAVFETRLGGTLELGSTTGYYQIKFSIQTIVEEKQWGAE